MKKTFITVLIACFTYVVQAQEMTLEEVLAAHYEAMGQEKLKDVQTVRYEGKMNQGIEIPLKLMVKRPGKFRMEGTVQGQTFVQAYDGNTGFMMMPNSPYPQDMNQDQIESMKDMGSVDLSLYTAEQEGHQMEYLGTEDFESSNVHLIKVTRENGDETTFYLDSKNYVILKAIGKTIQEGQSLESQVYFSNYKEVDGIIFPFYQEVKTSDGQTGMAITINNITLNSEISDDEFVRPQ